MKNNIVNVPYILYEKEMGTKITIIKMLIGVVLTLVIILALTLFMLMRVVNSHDYVSYAQDGNGQNNINTGTQGDVTNGSKTVHSN
jgi:hypothetical protein